MDPAQAPPKTGGGIGTTRDIHGRVHLKGAAKQQDGITAPAVDGQSLLEQAAGHHFNTSFAVREPVWGAAATIVGDYPGDKDTARQLAGHAWEPVETGMCIQEPDGTLVPVPGSKAIRRNDTMAVLGTCAETRESIGIGDMYDLVETLVDQPELKWEAGGTLGGGRQIWVMCKMDEPMEVPGDSSRVYPHLTVINRIVGPGACSLEWTTVRERSASCLGMTELTGRPPLRYQLRHTKNWKQRAEEIQVAVRGVQQQTAEWRFAAAYLAAKPVSQVQRQAYLAEFVPMPPEGIISDQVRDNVLDARRQISTILDSRSCDGISDTAWGLVQASAEYLDHVRYYRSVESRFKRCLLRPEPLKRKAVEIAVKLA